MVQRQFGDSHGMKCPYRKFKKAAFLNCFDQIAGACLDLTQPRLDGNFPNRSRGNENLLSRFQRATNTRLQGSISLDGPQKYVRIEQETHQRPSKSARTSARSRASKS